MIVCEVENCSTNGGVISPPQSSLCLLQTDHSLDPDYWSATNHIKNKGEKQINK